MTNEIIASSDAGFFGRVQNAEEVIGLGERELRVTESEHRGQCGCLLMAEWTHLLVAVEHCPQVVKVDGNVVATVRILRQYEPLHDVALDRLGDVVDGVGAVRQSEVDHGGGVRVRGGVAPEEVRGMKIIVGPQWIECRLQRLQLIVKGREQVEGDVAVLECLRVVFEHGVGGEIVLQAFCEILRSKDREARDKRTRLSGGSTKAFSGTVKSGQCLSSGASVINRAKWRPRDGVFVCIDSSGDSVDFIG